MGPTDRDHEADLPLRLHHGRDGRHIRRQCENFFCDTSAMCAAGAVAGMVAETGAAKLLFGSNSPEFYFEAAYNLVAEAQISDADSDAIIGENALLYLLPDGCQ